MHWFDGSGWVWWWVMMPLLMVVFWGGVIALVVWLVRGGRAAAGPVADRGSRAMEILEERFARGEIDREEFESRRSILEDRRSGP